MRRFWATTRGGATRGRASGPSVRYVYDRPLPYARNLRIDVVAPDGTVLSSTTATYRSGEGWITEAAHCA